MIFLRKVFSLFFTYIEFIKLFQTKFCYLDQIYGKKILKELLEKAATVDNSYSFPH